MSFVCLKMRSVVGDPFFARIVSTTKTLALAVFFVAGITAAAEDSFFDRELDREIALLGSDLGKPEAFVRIHAIWDLVDYACWDGRIPNALAGIVSSSKASPVLKSHSLWLLREVDLRSGDFDAAGLKQGQLGFITNWLIIGPFDNEGMAGFDLEYPPEGEIDLTQTYSGKERPVAWREYPKVSWGWCVDLSAVLRPVSKTAAYALACVFSPDSQQVAVRLGADDCAKVWVAGQPVISDQDSHPIGFDQAVAPATLEQGWNRILVKICQDEEDWGFWLRLTSLDGSPLRSLRVAAGRDEMVKALGDAKHDGSDSRAASPPDAQMTAADPIAEFRARVTSAPDNAEHRAALSFLLSHAKAYDKNTRADIKELETAAALSPREWRYHFRLGQLYQDENKRRAACERVIELNRDFAPAYSELGKHYSAKRLETKSLQFYRQAVEKDPSYYPAVFGLADFYARSSQKAKAAELLRGLLAAYPNTSYLLSQAVEFAPFPDTPQKLEDRCKAALRLNFLDQTARGNLLSSCYKRRDFVAAVDQLCAMERANPMSTSLLLEHAQLLADRGEHTEATVLIDRALEICPEDEEILRQKGEILLQQERREEALAWFEKSLATRPQNRPLREYVELLKPKEKAFEEDFKIDAAKAVSDASSGVGPGSDSAVYLFDLWIREVHPNGLSNSYHQEVVKILSEAAIEDFRFRRAIYRPTTDEIEVKSARIFKKDGRVMNADGPFTYTFGEEDKIYYDLEAKYVRFSNLEVGDAIEFSYRTNAIAPRNMYGDYFGDIIYFKDFVPKRSMEYVVLTSPEMKLHYSVVGMEIQPVIETRGNSKSYLWKVENMEKVESEPFMPGYSEVLPYVHVSTYQNWEDVGEWYWNLIRDQFLLDANASAEVARITRGLQTEQEKILAIYNHVVQNTRYIGLEFGIHSHKPYPAYKVYSRRYGDCKDKAGLMIAMLKEIGVDACLAALRTKSRGKIEPQPASLAVFNHAICYIPKYDLWLDGTAEYSGSSEFPYEDQDTCALVVGKGFRKFVTTPSLPGERNLISDVYEARISPDRAMEFELTRETVGQYAPHFRRVYQEEKDRSNALAKTWGGVLPNIKISEVRFSNLRDLEKPVRYAFRASASNYAVEDESGAMAFSGVINKMQLTRRYAPRSQRKYDLVLDFPWCTKGSTRFSLPPGYKVVSVPENADVQTSFGKYDIEFVVTEPGSVAMNFQFSFDVTRIRVEEYEAFRDFCRRVDEKEEEKIRIAK